MYRKIGEVSEQRRLALLDKAGEWRHKPPDFWVSVLDGKRMYLKIPPGGRLHPHVDNAGEKIHIVLQTNQFAVSRSGDDWVSLEQGGIYRMDPKIEHESINEGDTDRIHLVLST